MTFSSRTFTLYDPTTVTLNIENARHVLAALTTAQDDRLDGWLMAEAIARVSEALEKAYQDADEAGYVHSARVSETTACPHEAA